MATGSASGAGAKKPSRARKPPAEVTPEPSETVEPPVGAAPRPAAAPGRWVQPGRTDPETTLPAVAPPAPEAAPAALPPVTGPAVADTAPFAWMQIAHPPATTTAPVPATVAPSSQEHHGANWLTTDMGAAAAFAITLGLVALMLGSFLTGISSQTFLGSSLVSEFGRGFRFRLLAVFAGASFEPAVALVLAVLLTATVPAGRQSSLRRPALYLASALGVFVACAATLRAVALMTFLGTAAALAVGSTVSAVAAIPVAAAATAWAVVALTREGEPSKDQSAR